MNKAISVAALLLAAILSACSSSISSAPASTSSASAPGPAQTTPPTSPAIAPGSDLSGQAHRSEGQSEHFPDSQFRLPYTHFMSESAFEKIRVGMNRKLTELELQQALAVFRGSKQGRKLKKNSTYTIMSQYGLRD